MSPFRAPLVVALMVAGLAARAADDQPLSYAFASQAGSGIYSVEGRVVQIYRIPVSFDVKPLEEESRWGVSLALPVTFGFYDYKAADVLEGQLPSHIGTASLVPGIEFPVRAYRRWVLTPYAEAGAAKDFSGDALAWVYATGLRSVIPFPAGATWDGRAGQELMWAGAAATGNPLTDWYAEAKVGFEFRRELPLNVRKSRGDIGLFIVYERYFKEKTPTAVTYAAAAAIPGVNEQTEIGASFGTRPKLAWKKVSLPKLGLSYRFGDGVAGVRLVFGEIF